jgi:hypothetical protein
MQHDGVAGPGSQGDPGGAVDRHRQDKAIVVVGVLADEIDAAGRTDETRGWRAEAA